MFPLSQRTKIKREKTVAPNLSNPSMLINSKLNLKQEMISYQAKTKHTKFSLQFDSQPQQFPP